MGCQMGTIVRECCTGMSGRSNTYLISFAHISQDTLHTIEEIRLMPVQVAVMTVLYMPVKSTDNIGNEIEVWVICIRRTVDKNYIVVLLECAIL